MTDLHRRLLDATDASAPWSEESETAQWRALRAVIELHAPHPRISGLSGELLWVECTACTTPIVVQWPCSTIRTIAHELGVPTEGDH